jgi:hypothetical protein
VNSGVSTLYRNIHRNMYGDWYIIRAIYFIPIGVTQCRTNLKKVKS